MIRREFITLLGRADGEGKTMHAGVGDLDGAQVGGQLAHEHCSAPRRDLKRNIAHDVTLCCGQPQRIERRQTVGRRRASMVTPVPQEKAERAAVASRGGLALGKALPGAGGCNICFWTSQQVPQDSLVANPQRLTNLSDRHAGCGHLPRQFHPVGASKKCWCVGPRHIPLCSSKCRAPRVGTAF
jgi:hypothetical protein